MVIQGHQALAGIIEGSQIPERLPSVLAGTHWERRNETPAEENAESLATGSNLEY
jgi:hypothetical protein